MSELEIYKDDKYATIYYKKPFYITVSKSDVPQVHIESEKGYSDCELWFRNEEICIKAAKIILEIFGEK